MALKGLKVIEIVGLAPAPMCGMILSDFGANVIRIDKPYDGSIDILRRGKKTIAVDLKKDDGKTIFKRLCIGADVVIEPFRPGVMERLGLGPNILMESNKRLIYARLSGFGQNGPLSSAAGHDINYLAVSGILDKLGDGKRLQPPINILGDFAGGGFMCALGICMALFERFKSGKGQMIDANIVEGVSYLSSWLWHSSKLDCPIKEMLWFGERGTNTLDGGAPFYRCYRTKDNKFMAVGSLEPQFYARLLDVLQLNPDEYSQFHIENWSKMTEGFSLIFETKTQEEWIRLFDGRDACVTPVVDFDKASEFGHNKVRESFFKDGTPKPSPVLSRTPANPSIEEFVNGQHTKEVLFESGFTNEEINKFLNDRTIESADVTSKL